MHREIVGVGITILHSICINKKKIRLYFILLHQIQEQTAQISDSLPVFVFDYINLTMATFDVKNVSAEVWLKLLSVKLLGPASVSKITVFVIDCNDPGILLLVVVPDPPTPIPFRKNAADTCPSAGARILA
jgi:hypothetical protein